jgi:hypothetical protein
MEGFAGAFGATIVYPIDLGMSLWMSCLIVTLLKPVAVKVCRAFLEWDFDRDPRFRVRIRRGTFRIRTDAS